VGAGRKKEGNREKKRTSRRSNYFWALFGRKEKKARKGVGVQPLRGKSNNRSWPSQLNYVKRKKEGDRTWKKKKAKVALTTKRGKWGGQKLRDSGFLLQRGAIVGDRKRC